MTGFQAVARSLRGVIFAGAWTVVIAFVGAANAASEPTLGDVHKMAGVNCAACHAESPPSRPESVAACIRCHGEAPTLAEKTREILPNPHASPHLPAGETQPCTECHHVHVAEEVTCAACHKVLKDYRFRYQRRQQGGPSQ